LKLAILESPFAGNTRRNKAYARACLTDSLRRGEAPLASNILYTQTGVLNDTDPGERRLGMEAGFAWGKVADLVVFYVDFGWSAGMNEGLRRARERNAHVRTRTLGGPWSALAPSDAHFSAG
jgi:hypothetical protein